MKAKTKKSYLDTLKKQLDEEKLIYKILLDKRRRVNLINKLRLDRAFCIGFRCELIKKGFLDKTIRNFFYNINDYIESLLYPAFYESKHENDKIRYVFADCKSDYLADLFWLFRL